MGVIWSSLALIQPHHPDGTRVELPALPSDVPLRLEQGSCFLDAGLLVGEKMGLELAHLSACLNEVWFAPAHRGRGLFMDEDIPVLLEGYTRIRNALRTAIDAHGRPRGVMGEQLRVSSSIEQYSDGGLVTRTRRVRLVDLLGGLDELLRFLTFARDHRLFIRDEEEPSTPGMA